MTTLQSERLGDVAEVSSGNPAPQDERLFLGGVHPFFRTSDIGRIHFGDIHEANDLLNDEGVKGLRRYPAGTILFPKSGASTFLNHRVMLGVDGYVSSHLATIVADTARIEPRFLLYFLATICAQDMIQDHAYPSLNLPAIASIRVPVPPITEQRRVLRILDTGSKALHTAMANAEKAVKNARGLLESELLSVFANRGEDWVQGPLLDLCDRSRGITYGVIKLGAETVGGSHASGPATCVG